MLQEIPKKVAKFEEEASARTEFFEVQEKVKSDAVIPLLQSLLGNILEHKDPSKIASGDISLIENCMEQIITKGVPVDVLVEHKIGRLLKSFYDFVQLSSHLKTLNVITRCALKRLKKRTWKELFGERKTLQFIVAENNELTNVPIQQLETTLNEKVKEEIEDDTKANGEVDKTEELPLPEVNQAVITNTGERERRIRKPTHTYDLRRTSRKPKKRIASCKQHTKAPVPKIKRVEEEKKARAGHKEKEDNHVKELIKMLEEVLSTLITRIERNKGSGEYCAGSGG